MDPGKVGSIDEVLGATSRARRPGDGRMVDEPEGGIIGLRELRDGSYRFSETNPDDPVALFDPKSLYPRAARDWWPAGSAGMQVHTPDMS